MYVFFFFFNDTATTEIYTLSLHDALPIYRLWRLADSCTPHAQVEVYTQAIMDLGATVCTRHKPLCARSEEHTSELQSQSNLVCRLLLEKKKDEASTRDDSRQCCLHALSAL